MCSFLKHFVGTTLRALKAFPQRLGEVRELVERGACQPMNGDFRSIHRNPHDSQVPIADRNIQKEMQMLSQRAFGTMIPTVSDRVDNRSTYALSAISILQPSDIAMLNSWIIPLNAGIHLLPVQLL
jgi:hypothetical protein